MDEDSKDVREPRVTRRRFIGTLSGAVAAAAFVQRASSSNSPAQTYYDQDSFGNVVPAAEETTALGIYPPSVPNAAYPQRRWTRTRRTQTSATQRITTHPTPSNPEYNILLVMVDQMRNPAFWLASGNNWVTAYQDILPSSSVDILPFLYTLALGNHSWRNDGSDMVYYLRGRESINDAIYQYATGNNAILPQRRISSVPLYNNSATGCNNNCALWQLYQPFVLHTADDCSIARFNNGSYVPSHAIAFRTVDLTNPNANAAPFPGQTTYGGGKLGIYSYWDTCDQNNAPIYPISYTSGNAPPYSQFEFYNYSLYGNLDTNPQEIRNQFFDSGGNITTEANQYLTDFLHNNNTSPYPPGANVQGELYQLNTYNNNSANNTKQAYAAIQLAFQNYLLYLQCVGNMTGSNGTLSVCNTNCGNYTGTL